MKLLLYSPHARLCYTFWMCFLLAGCGGGGGTSSTVSQVTGGISVPCAPSTPVPGSTGALIKIMPLGDSITAGTNVGGSSSYRLGLWNHFIQDHINAQFVGSVCTGTAALGSRQNEGHSGYKIEQISANVDHWIAAAPSDYILLMIGTNNRNDADFLAAGPGKLSALIDQIVRDAPAVTVLVASIPPVKTMSTDRKVQQYNAAVGDIVRSKHANGEKIYFVDVHRVLTTADIGDEVHPNANGDQKIADAWYKALKPLLP